MPSDELRDRLDEAEDRWREAENRRRLMEGDCKEMREEMMRLKRERTAAYGARAEEAERYLAEQSSLQDALERAQEDLVAVRKETTESIQKICNEKDALILEQNMWLREADGLKNTIANYEKLLDDKISHTTELESRLATTESHLVEQSEDIERLEKSLDKVLSASNLHKNNKNDLKAKSAATIQRAYRFSSDRKIYLAYKREKQRATDAEKSKELVQITSQRMQNELDRCRDKMSELELTSTTMRRRARDVEGVEEKLVATIEKLREETERLSDERDVIQREKRDALRKYTDMLDEAELYDDERLEYKREITRLKDKITMLEENPHGRYPHQEEVAPRGSRYTQQYNEEQPPVVLERREAPSVAPMMTERREAPRGNRYNHEELRYTQQHERYNEEQPPPVVLEQREAPTMTERREALQRKYSDEKVYMKYASSNDYGRRSGSRESVVDEQDAHLAALERVARQGFAARSSSDDIVRQVREVMGQYHGFEKREQPQSTRLQYKPRESPPPHHHVPHHHREEYFEKQHFDGNNVYRSTKQAAPTTPTSSYPSRVTEQVRYPTPSSRRAEAVPAASFARSYTKLSEEGPSPTRQQELLPSSSSHFAPSPEYLPAPVRVSVQPGLKPNHRGS